MRNDMKGVILSLLIVMFASFVIGVAILFMSGNLPSEFLEIDEVKTYKMKTDNGAIDIIDVFTANTDVNFIPVVDSEEIKAHFYGNVKNRTKKPIPELTVSRTESRLNIEITHPKGLVVDVADNIARDTTLDIYIPDNYTRVIKVATLLGDVGITDLEIKEFQCNTVSGDLVARSLHSGKSIVKTTSGNLDMSTGMGELTAETVSGNVTVWYEILNSDIEIKTMSGDVKIELPEDAVFYFKFDTLSGNFENTFPIIIVDLSERTVEGTVGGGGYGIKVTTVSGDLMLWGVKRDAE
jgi:lia operon protein LiaG